MRCPTPGATRSGFARKSIHVGPDELNAAIVVVGARERAERARRADGDHPRRVGRRGDAAPLQLAVGVLSEVAGGDDDRDAPVGDRLGRQPSADRSSTIHGWRRRSRR